jgi:hypothetical protein
MSALFKSGHAGGIVSNMLDELSTRMSTVGTRGVGTTVRSWQATWPPMPASGGTAPAPDAPPFAVPDAPPGFVPLVRPEPPVFAPPLAELAPIPPAADELPPIGTPVPPTPVAPTPP